MRIDATAEYEKWLQFDTRLIFTNCGALTWYLRKAWLLDNAPELMPPSDPAEAFDIRRSVRSRLAKADYFSHVRIRARLAFADRLLFDRRAVYNSKVAAFVRTRLVAATSDCAEEQTWRAACEPDVRVSDQTSADSRSEPDVPGARPGKPRSLNIADVGHQWIYLKWRWPRSEVTRLGYRIERSRQRKAGYEVIAVTHACDLLLVPVNSGTTYFYRVRAFNPAGDGPPSDAIAGIAF